MRIIECTSVEEVDRGAQWREWHGGIDLDAAGYSGSNFVDRGAIDLDRGHGLLERLRRLLFREVESDTDPLFQPDSGSDRDAMERSVPICDGP